MMKQFLYSLILFSAVFTNVYAKNIDSLHNVFEQSKQLDSSYYNAFNELTHHYIKLESDSCLYYTDKLIKDYPDSAFRVAMAFRKKANYFKSVNRDSSYFYIEKSLNEVKNIKNSFRKWEMFYMCYDLFSFNKKKEKNFYESLRFLDSSLKYVNLCKQNSPEHKYKIHYLVFTYRYAYILDDQEKSNEALSYCRLLLDSIRVLDSSYYDHKKIEKSTYGMIGVIFQNQQEYDSAIYYFQKSYNMVKDQGYLIDKVIPLHNIAENYILKEDFKTGLKILNEVKSMVDSLKSNPTPLYYTYARAYDSLHQDKIALEYYLKFYEESKEVDNIYNTKIATEALYYSYKKINNSKQALSYYKEYISVRDSIDKMKASEETLKRELQRKYELKVQEDSIKNIEREKLNESQLALSETKIKDTKNLIIVVSIVVILLMLFSVIVYIRYKESVKQKKIIAAQKEQVDIAFNQLDEKKVELEKKNTEVMDSINYAKYIQKALLPSKESIENFFENQFIFYLPKDIVGGDFYCFKSIGDQAVIVAGDCTGHGVPGGFGTMIGSLVIEKSLKKGLKNPNQILTDLNHGIVTLLKQYKDDSIQDGMDISICLVDKKTKKVKFSGSRNGIHIVDTEEIHSIKGDLTPVGGYAASHEESKNRSYQLHEIELKDNQWIFMYSDGFYDQFGGPRNKSMGSSRFKGIIQEAVTMNKTNAPDFKNYFFDWMGDEEQIDDVLVIGFKL